MKYNADEAVRANFFKTNFFMIFKSNKIMNKVNSILCYHQNNKTGMLNFPSENKAKGKKRKAFLDFSAFSKIDCNKLLDK